MGGYTKKEEMKFLRTGKMLFIVALVISVVSCGPSEENVPIPQSESKIADLLKKSAGKWESLTDEERKQLTLEIGNGNEQTARMGFEARAATSAPPVPGPGSSGAR